MPIFPACKAGNMQKPFDLGTPVINLADTAERKGHMDQYLAGLTTETVNPNTRNIDMCETEDILRLINAEDAAVPGAVAKELPRLAQAVDIAYEALRGGGRMFYVGCGTSGRLGVLDASECPPTYGTDPELVQGYIAGGDAALRTAIEGSEDDADAGARLIADLGLTQRDVLVGITASGSAPFVLGAVDEARRRGAACIALVNNPASRLAELCDVAIAPVVGPEVIMGSTRMKAGTAQKLVLNMLSTSVMIKMGKVYHNLMVDLRATNRKLRDRSVRIICAATDVSPAQAADYLEQAGGQVKTAIMMIGTGLARADAEAVLNGSGGRLAQAIEQCRAAHA